MKRITFGLITAILLMFAGWTSRGQAVNVPANWPNSNWTLNIITHTGSGTQDIEADPTTADHFAYDDDDTGSGHDVLAAESPVIDISAGPAAGENYLIISGDYVYNNISSDEYLAIEYWDADASNWVLWYEFPDQDTQGAPYDNFCSGTPEHYTANLDISSFSSTQLSGFKYRIIYNDDVNGSGHWAWGFCFSSPEIHSAGVVYTDPTFTLTEQPDCANNQFSVDVNVTDLGNASSVTVTDDQGSASQQLTAPGTVTFGPYADGTDVTFTVTNDDDGSYSSTDHIQYYCPPDNDDCANAIALTIGASCSPITADNLGATDSGAGSPGCANYQGGDVWFTVTPSTTDTLIVETSSVSGSDLHDTGMAIYTGDCTNLTQVACDDDGGNGAFSKITVNTPTANATYYVRVWEYGNNSFGEFGICAYQPQLGVNTLTSDEFSFYPNPTNGVITWKANGTVDRVQILNLTGQVLAQEVQPAANRMDISRLPKGVYMLQVQMGDRTGTYRLIKE